MKNAVVIGSGFGGLAMANRLAARGLDVTLLEKRDKIGGRAYQLKDSGYTFDMGPSLITAPDIIADIFAAAGEDMGDYLDLIALDPFYRIYYHDGSHIDYTGDPESMKTQMRRFNERDADNYDAFMDRIRPIYDAVIGEKLGAKPFTKAMDMVKFVPRAMKMGALSTVTSVAERYFEDFRHRFMFSFHPLFIGGNPFRSPGIYLSIPYLEREGGVWFTPGGMYSVVEALGKLLVKQGGRIVTGAEVESVEVHDGKAVGVYANGTYYPADLVVSNADVAHTYRDLISEDARRHWNERRLKRIKHSMSCFLLYIGTRRQYPKLEHHTLILSQRYKDLVRDIFDKQILPDDFSMYLHAPTRSDSSMAPPGGESMYVLIPVANLGAELDWNELREPFTNKVLDFLEQWGLEDLRANIDVLHSFTPLEFHSELNATLGNAFAIEPRLTQTAYFRPHNRSEDVANLYFVGAGTHPGAGVPGVMLSAECAENCILEDHPGLGALPFPAREPEAEHVAAAG